MGEYLANQCHHVNIANRWRQLAINRWILLHFAWISN